MTTGSCKKLEHDWNYKVPGAELVKLLPSSRRPMSFKTSVLATCKKCSKAGELWVWYKKIGKNRANLDILGATVIED